MSTRQVPNRMAVLGGNSSICLLISYILFFRPSSLINVSSGCFLNS